jgi:putative redox protein
MTRSATDTGILEVGWAGGEQYWIDVRGHKFAVDQPVDAGGTDSAPTPTELFVASLTGCVAFYAGRYLTRHGFDRTGLTVRAGYTMADRHARPARVAAIRVVVHPPAGFPAERVPALTAVVKRCTVHNTLADPPDVAVWVG